MHVDNSKISVALSSYPTTKQRKATFYFDNFQRVRPLAGAWAGAASAKI